MIDVVTCLFVLALIAADVLVWRSASAASRRAFAHSLEARWQSNAARADADSACRDAERALRYAQSAEAAARRIEQLTNGEPLGPTEYHDDK